MRQSRLERGVLSPDTVDPHTNYRSYSSAQLRQGVTVDLLRRAGVPVTELTRWADYPFADRRQELALRRAMEDFSLDVAEEISRSDLARLTVQSTPADPLPWAGVSYGFPVPAKPRNASRCSVPKPSSCPLSTPPSKKP
ncbi:hypothetical protein [Modestobacter sp. KNN46-3]|uniref:hypothetical protein n=1 Tax=Modestobacter sp. KNN46-3 TaxID=2711218 RepID=UPI0013E01161|nr:hypothetical protein [Modestobacter sp. KNN46-3]